MRLANLAADSADMKMPFVLTIEPHRISWCQDFASEAARVRNALGCALNALHHIGSTAIPRIYAKPIIDMLADVTSLAAVEEQAHELQAMGYEAMGEFGIPGRRYFRKTNRSGRRTHHLHAFVQRSPHIVRHLAFRDFLLAHPDTAQAYSELKRGLVKTCKGDLEAYMDGKDAFIAGVEKQALEWASR